MHRYGRSYESGFLSTSTMQEIMASVHGLINGNIHLITGRTFKVCLDSKILPISHDYFLNNKIRIVKEMSCFSCVGYLESCLNKSTVKSKDVSKHFLRKKFLERKKGKVYFIAFTHFFLHSRTEKNEERLFPKWGFTSFF